MNDELKEKLTTLPRAPGVYFHKSRAGEIIYVGKAAILKNRVRQYFQVSKDFDAKTKALVAEIHDTDWVETESEIDALFLESEMVKRYMPRYNVLLRDDKSQLYVRIDMKNEWPHVSFTREPIDDGAQYYGPFYNGYAVKKALRYLRKVFPYYTKSPTRRIKDLDVDMGLSPAPDTTSREYKAILKKLIKYIEGGRVTITKEIEKDMKRAARSHEFERAAQLRNKLKALGELQRRIMFGDREFLDISKDKALSDLKQLFGLSKEPSRIEGYDISHMSGDDVVASMVVFTNGVSDRAEYRKFKMASQRNDDYKNLRETLLRRFGEKNRKVWGAPDLVLIDGGKGQLDSALAALMERGVNVPCIALAKREEVLIVHKAHSNIDDAVLRRLITSPVDGVWIEESREHYTINLHAAQRNASGHSKNLRGSTGLVSPYDDIVKLVQRIRDESHRFAVSYHTVLKRSRQTKSVLDDIPGIGPKTKKALLSHFGSVRRMTVASDDELRKVVGPKTVEAIRRHVPRPEHSTEA